MNGQPWLLALVVVVGGLHALAALYTYWSTQSTDDGVTPAAGADRSVWSAAVECPSCGTTNERRYRYCAACVSRLPGPDAVGETSTPPVGRRIR
jgi:hypothetical protein